jgi:hypothetical protein
MEQSSETQIAEFAGHVFDRAGQPRQESGASWPVPPAGYYVVSTFWGEVRVRPVDGGIVADVRRADGPLFRALSTGNPPSPGLTLPDGHGREYSGQSFREVVEIEIAALIHDHAEKRPSLGIWVDGSDVVIDANHVLHPVNEGTAYALGFVEQQKSIWKEGLGEIQLLSKHRGIAVNWLKNWLDQVDIVPQETTDQNSAA